MSQREVMELKPCPFCGSEVNLLSNNNKLDPVFEIECPHVDCHGYNSYRVTDKEAIAAWNKRAELAKPERTFSDFIRNATDAEREVMYMQVMDAVSEQQRAMLKAAPAPAGDGEVE